MNIAATRGFTMLELLTVVAIVAIGAATAVISLGSVQTDVLEREGERLAALLEAGRARSRMAGVPVIWRVEGEGFVFDGLPPGDGALPQHWLDESVHALGDETLLLGPDPIIAAQGVTLVLGVEGAVRSIRVATDGLHPFAVETAEESAP